MIQAILIVLVAYLIGRGALRILYKRPLMQEFSRADSVLVGGMVIIGLAEAAHLGAVVLGRSFSDCVKLFMLGLLLLLFVSAIMVALGKRLERHDKLFVRENNRQKIKKAMTTDSHQTENRVIFFVFGLIVLIQLLMLVTEQKIYPTGDMTAETVNSMLTTNGIYGVNPLTGQAYTTGIPMRLKILCLPTLYAIICEIFGMSASQVVWTLVPALTLLGSYLAFFTVAKALFPAEAKKRGIFMVIVALLLWMGDYLYGMDGFAVQYAGFRGVSIRMAILLPYTFGLVIRRKWRLVLLCVLAEASIVWTLYGMGACLFAATGMILIELLYKKIATKAGKEGGL